ncbi:MAG: putative glycoside hydrolase [Candidatus Bathyarchaeota archaeon B24]|nr:MAG: putative glycoside hydrolase [Candidatus Bathyarchaeota archaeon B24]
MGLRKTLLFVGLSGVLIVLLAYVLAGAPMKKTVEVDFSKVDGRFKPLHRGVNDGPLYTEQKLALYDLSDYYRELQVRWVRLHDQWGAVDVDYVFPDMSADPSDPESYDFQLTDRCIVAIHSIGAEVIYRLGYRWHEPPLNKPPEDYDKWADVCLHIAMHYNERWADGYRFNITYWEIWNEPDIERFWNGTLEDYWRLYDTVARKIKERYPWAKVGGPTIAWNLDFLRGFLKLCREHDSPIDFVSWHVYSKNPYDIYEKAEAVKRVMNEEGFGHLPSFLTEWNIWKDDRDPYDIFRNEVGASFQASALIYLQNSSVDVATLYRGDAWDWGGIFVKDLWKPGKPFYVHKAFNMLMETPLKAWCKGSDKKGFAAVAGISEKGDKAMVIISNYGEKAVECQLKLKGLKWRGISYVVRAVDGEHSLEMVDKGVLETAENGQELVLNLPPYSVYVVTLSEA